MNMVHTYELGNRRTIGFVFLFYLADPFLIFIYYLFIYLLAKRRLNLTLFILN